MVEFMVLTAPVVYRTLVTVGKSGEQILYMKLKKDLDGSCNPNKCDICHDKRNVIIMDIPRAYLMIEINKEVHIILEEKMVELIVLTAIEIYHTFVTIGKVVIKYCT